MKTATKSNRKPLVYSYLRFSSTPQEMGDSIRRQNDLIQKWCQDKGLTLDESYRMEDRGLSGFHGDNLLIGELGQFLKDVEAGKVERGSYLILESLDRFSRMNVNDVIHRLTGLITHGIRIVTLCDGRQFSDENSSDITQLMLMVLESGRANSESLHKSKRLRESWEGKRVSAKTGSVLSKIVPYGYWVENRNYSSGRPQGGKITVHPTESQYVKLIFDLAAQGQSPSVIARTLNKDHKVKSRKGGMWGASMVNNILNNRAYLTGEHQPCQTRKENGRRVYIPTGEIIPDYYPVIIPPALWKQVHNTLINKQTTKRTPHKHGISNLFTGKIVCASCGSIVTVKNTTDKQSIYICENAKQGYGCKYRSIPSVILETQFILSLCDILDKEASQKTDNSQIHDLLNMIADKELEKSTLTRKVDTWDEELPYRDNEGKKALRVKIIETGKEVSRLTQEIAGLQSQLDNVRSTKGLSESYILGTLLDHDLVNLKSPETRVDLKALIDKVVKSLTVNFEDRYMVVEFNDDTYNAEYEDEPCVIDLPLQRVKEYLNHVKEDELFRIALEINKAA